MYCTDTKHSGALRTIENLKALNCLLRLLSFPFVLKFVSCFMTLQGLALLFYLLISNKLKSLKTNTSLMS